MVSDNVTFFASNTPIFATCSLYVTLLSAAAEMFVRPPISVCVSTISDGRVILTSCADIINEFPDKLLLWSLEFTLTVALFTTFVPLVTPVTLISTDFVAPTAKLDK